MRIGDIVPHLRKCSYQEFLGAVPYEGLYENLLELSEDVASKLPLHQILNEMGANILPLSPDQQFRCVLPWHGTQDLHPSARYYTYNRDSGEEEESFYCFKCNEASNSFWLLYKLAKLDNEKIDLRLFLNHLNERYGVEISREIVLMYDPNDLSNLIGGSDSIRQEFLASKALLDVFSIDKELYLNKLSSYLK